jgi:hypothetical protein
MIDCDQVFVLLAVSPLEDLLAADADRVTKHLEKCTDCTNFVAAYDAVAAMVRKALDVEVDDRLQAELDAAVMQALRLEA